MKDTKWNKMIEEYSDEEIEKIKDQKEAIEILDVQERELEERMIFIKAYRECFWDYKYSIKTYKRWLKSRNEEAKETCFYTQNPNKEK